MLAPGQDDLIRLACELIRKRFAEGQHHVAAALRTRSGKVFTGLHIEAYVGRVTVCAEAVALGTAATAGDTEIETIVAVDSECKIVSPCGMCRELISEYSPSANVIIQRNGEAVAVPIADLLPDKYQR